MQSPPPPPFVSADLSPEPLAANSFGSLLIRAVIQLLLPALSYHT